MKLNFKNQAFTQFMACEYSAARYFDQQSQSFLSLYANWWQVIHKKKKKKKLSFKEIKHLIQHVQ